MKSPEERASLAAKWREHNVQKKTPPKAAAAPVQQIAKTEEDIRWDKRIDALMEAVPVGPDGYKTLQMPGAWYRYWVGRAS